MKPYLPILNTTLELADCQDKWFLDETYHVWCLEDILYTMKATTPKFQRMSIFVPEAYLNADGTINADGVCGNYNAKTAPVVFENNSAGYMQMPHTWLGGPRDEGPKYLQRGMVYVTCGCRGRESRDQEGKLCGKSPWALIDLKTGIRFLRHNAAVLPGDMGHMVSVGWSAGGAMSTLVSVTGDHPDYLPYLEQNGAFMDESDAVYAGQIYCPILDLDHADLAYEWQFQNDPENESSPAGPAGTFTPFQAALSQKLAAAYISYFNGLSLKNPETGEPLVLNEDGRSGSGYDYLMAQLEKSAADYLSRLDRGELPEQYTSVDYLTGNYTHLVDAPKPDDGPEEKDDLGLHHAGAAVAMPPLDDGMDGDKPAGPPSLGDLVSRPPKGVPYVGMEFPKVEAPGTDKSAWLTWDGKQAKISDLDTYILNHRRRMKPCTSFDTLGMDSGENQEFGTPENDYLHFNPYIPALLDELRVDFPDEVAQVYDSWATVPGDTDQATRRSLINPMVYLDKMDQCSPAGYYRINVGACDADTAFIVSMSLAVKLANLGKDVEYHLIWDKPHCEADYPFEVCDWVEKISGRHEVPEVPLEGSRA
ncbi:MAG: hypothetical protein LUD84_11795 [Clostridiales bacterium]|nr:hypothetical protein [Clostridiales bacterium]